MTGSGSTRRDDARRRGAQAARAPRRPWRLIAASAVLAVALLGTLVYALGNQGSGSRDVLAEADGIDGVAVTAEEDLSADHVPDRVDYPGYPGVPPNNGPHAPPPLWQDCGVYDQPLAPEHAVHSLEHGAVWITYDPERVDGAALDRLREKTEDDTYRLLSPLPEQDSAVVLSAWGRTLELDDPADERVDEFLDAYTQGPQTPEPGAPCSGGVSAPDYVTS